VDICR